jgi:hypothetical protein
MVLSSSTIFQQRPSKSLGQLKFKLQLNQNNEQVSQEKITWLNSDGAIALVGCFQDIGRETLV